MAEEVKKRRPTGKQRYEQAVVDIAEELPHLTDAIADLTNEVQKIWSRIEQELSRKDPL